MKNDKMSFEEFKKEILNRAYIKKACTRQYTKAMKTKRFKSLFNIIKDNFTWCIINNIIDIPFLLKVKEQTNKNNILIRGDGNDKYFKEDSTVNFIIMFPDIGICSNWGNNGSRYYKTI